MNPNTSFAFLDQGERNKRWHDDVLPGSGFLYNSLPLDSVGWHDDSLPRAGFLYKSVPLDTVGWHGDFPPEAGFSTSRRASPEAHQSKPNLPVSRCRYLLAFCRTTAPPEPDTRCCSLRMKISEDLYIG